jgi:DNA-binding PadR family transcriptional regulator
MRSAHQNVSDRGAVRGQRRTNDPPLLILTSLADGPKHGHALLKDIEGFAGVTLSPGALYGAITRLEERGLIEPLDFDDRRRPYRLTSAGSAALSESVSQMHRLAEVGAVRLGISRVPRPRLT